MTDEKVLDFDHRDDDATPFRSDRPLGILEQRNFDVKYLVCRLHNGSSGSLELGVSIRLIALA